jgi:type II secretory ATPase GspE/PulE/Tfp pilus assembly ATPase PilB-like protein
MGVEPYLIPPVLILGIAQRLVKTLCPKGGKKIKVEPSVAEMFAEEFADLPKEYQKNIPKLDEVYVAEATPDCPSGTRGRIACFEMYEMNRELESAILARKPEEALFAAVRKAGMLTMKEDAIIKSARGVIPFEEVNTLGGAFEMPEETPVAVAAAQKPVALDENAVETAESKEISV